MSDIHATQGPPTCEGERSSEVVLRFVDAVLGDVEPRDFSVRLRDGTTWGPGDGEEARFTLVLNDPSALRRLFPKPTDLAAGEAFIYGDIDIEGDVEAVFEVADRVVRRDWSVRDIARLGSLALKLPTQGRSGPGERAARPNGRAHSKDRDSETVQIGRAHV